MEVHNAVGVFIFTDEKEPRTLLVKHKKFGVWFQPGGHQEVFENLLEAAIREVKEETGIDLTVHLAKPMQLDSAVRKMPLPKYILVEKIPQHKDTPEHIHQDSIYFVRIPYQEISLAELEHDDIKWFKKEELIKLELLENTKKLLFEIFNGIDKPEE